MSNYVVCVKNEGYPASLELRKLYRVVEDASAQSIGQLRVVDESGEDYLYPSEFFLAVSLPAEVEEAVSGAA
jgi:hypothetical protein